MESKKEFDYEQFSSFMAVGIGLSGLYHNQEQLIAIVSDIHDQIPKLRQEDHTELVYTEEDCDIVLAVLSAYINLLLLEHELSQKETQQ